MGKVFDPELYRATEKHFAHQPLPANPNKWETWHTDAVYDNGYYSTIMFATSGPVIMVDFHVIDSSGKPVIESMQFFQPEDFEVSTEVLDIRMGENTYKGTYPKYHLSVHDGNNGAELTYEAVIQPTLSEIPDGVGLGRMKTPYMPVTVSWYFRPVNKITGTLIVDGKEVSVTGTGWADHQWGTADYYQDAVYFNYWGCFPLGKHTLNLYEYHLADKSGYRPLKWLWDWKGDKLYEYDRDCDYYVVVSDIEPGDTVPKKLKFIFETNRIRGIITCDFKTLLQKQVIEVKDRTVIINRSSYNCVAKLKIDGEVINKKFTRIVEIGYSAEQQAEEEGVFEVKKPEVKPTKYSIDSKLGDLLKTPTALEILERFMPGISTNAQVKMGYGMAFKTIAGFPQSGISKEKLAAIDEELRTLE